MAFLLAVFAASLIFPEIVKAQETKIEVVLSSPPSPVGAGARALGAGSAFIALADDATAASWNPAGLIQLERPEISSVGAFTYQVDSFGELEERTSEKTTLVDAGTDSFDTLKLNYLSAAIPFSLFERNIVVSLNYQQMLSFDRSLTFGVKTNFTTGNMSNAWINFKQSGGVDAFSPAFAIEILPSLSIGGALNYWFDGIGRSYAWKAESEFTSISKVGKNTYSSSAIEINTFEDFQGINGTLGFLWNFYQGFSFGAVFDIPFEANLTYESYSKNLTTGVVGGSKQDLKMSIPLSYGFGLSWRVNDTFVASMDLTRVEWGDFRLKDEGGFESLVTGDPEDEFDVDGVTTVRAGAEYLWILDAFILALRGGLFYDPEPSRGSPESFYGTSLGFGITRPSFSFDFAYQLRFGLGVSDISILNQVATTPTDEVDIFQHFFYLSAVYYL